MDPQWYIVIISWTAIFGVMIGLSIHERRKTPEQRQAERERIAARRQAQQPHKKTQTSPGGCLQNVITTWLLCVAVFVAILFAICIAISTD